MSSEAYRSLSKGERFIYDWQYRMLGGFMNALAECMTRADNDNMRRLMIAFPEEGAAMILYKNDESFWPKLDAKVNSTQVQ